MNRETRVSFLERKTSVPRRPTPEEADAITDAIAESERVEAERVGFAEFVLDDVSAWTHEQALAVLAPEIPGLKIFGIIQGVRYRFNQATRALCQP